MPPDDLSHLPVEVAGRIRENLSRLHRRLAGIPRAELEARYSFLAIMADCAVDVAFLVHLQAMETARLPLAVQRAETAAGRLEREERRLRRARIAAWVAVGVAVGSAVLSLVRG
jgi:hypothetical protein